MKTLFALLMALGALCVPAIGAAQTGSLIIDQNRPDRSPPTAAPAPTPPPGAGKVEAAQPAASTSFLLAGVDIQGSSLPAAVFRPAYSAHIGQSVTTSDLSAIADAIGAIYAKSDIALYTVLLPRQSFKDGQVRIRVVEGYVSEVDIQVARKGQKTALLRRYGNRLMAEQPLRRRTLERYISLMRDIPGGSLDIALLQGGKPGAVKLVAKAKQKRVDFGLSVNNRGSAYLGRTQIQVSASLDSLLRQGDQTTLSFSFPTEFKRFQYVSLSHSEPIGATGATVSVNLGYLRTRPDIPRLDLTGTAKVAGVQVSYPFMRGYSQNLYLTGALDGVDSDNALFGQTFSREKTRNLRLAAAYSRQSAKRMVSASVTVSQGLNGLGARLANPLYAAPDYRKVNAQLAVNQAIDKRWVVRLAAAGQFTADRLPASEQFSIGGAQFGRAFAASEATGDSGYGASAEVAYVPAKNVPQALAGSELYGFVDTARATAQSRTRLHMPRHSSDLSSAGGGVRIALAGKGVVELEAAKALDEVQERSGSRPWRLMVNFRSTF